MRDISTDNSKRMGLRAHSFWALPGNKPPARPLCYIYLVPIHAYSQENEMGTRFVYRVETRNGEGPYNNHGDWDMRMLASEMCNRHLDSAHPGPYEDKEITTRKPISYFLDEEHFFGFTTTDQLIRWFGSFIPRLGEFGFVVSVYEVDEDYVIETRHQCAFHRGLAQFHTTYPIRAFHTEKENDNA